MKKRQILIPLILAIIAFGGCEKKPESKTEAGEKAGKGEEHGEEGEAGHVKLTPEQRKNAAIKIEKAGAATIKTLLPVYGKISTNEESLAHVQPRFPGIVKEVRKRLGDRVEKGDVLAVVESNDSLRPYEIKSEVAGTIIEKKVSLGEFVKNEDTIFAIADLSSVWVDLSVFRQDFARLKDGLPVWIHPGDDAEAIESKVAYISPFGTEGSQTMLARCVVPNLKGDLRPGLFITAEIGTGETDAPVAVKLGALQTLKEKTVVFVQEGEEFEPREVELGAKDGERVEILSGVLPGEKYVSEGSFIVKSQALKAEMSDND